MERELLKGNTPTLVLAVLQDGPLHGYAIAREIEKRSDRALTFKEGTLYPALHTLEEQGLVTGEWQKIPGERDRKVYTVTDEGRAALEDRMRTWMKFSGAINRVLSKEAGSAPSSPPQSAAPQGELPLLRNPAARPSIA